MTAATISTSPREELLELLLRDGILRRGRKQLVRSRDGTSARWMLDSLAVTTTKRGAELAGRLMLQSLRSFDGCQLATHGVTAIPLLQSMVMLSGGGCHGLIVRKDRKPYGASKWIEGPVDQRQPVVMIEDSVASGTSVLEGIEKVESEGLRVEGCIILVRFGWDGGFSLLNRRGYHTEFVYDIFEDLMPRILGEPAVCYNPTKAFSLPPQSTRRLEDGLHPAVLARRAMVEYLKSGCVPLPPSRMDAEYDSRGGTWVSVRSRADIHDRHAREGFWHFPQERGSGACADLVRAAIKTAEALPRTQALQLLNESHVAVTFFTALEKTTPSGLDNRRYGIVVVSRERPEVMGGALPAMPGIRDEFQQLRHAKDRNAGLEAHESFSLYRHEVRKYPEPDVRWQSSGVPTEAAAFDGSAFATRAREHALGITSNPSYLPPLPVDAVLLFVTVYLDGAVRGCLGSAVEKDLDAQLQELVKGALADERFDDPRDWDEVAVSVSILGNELDMGAFSQKEVALRYCHGQQALGVRQGEREAMLLPCVATWMNLDADEFVSQLLAKAGIRRGPFEWRRWDCETWIASARGSSKMDGAFPCGDRVHGVFGQARNRETLGFSAGPFADAHGSESSKTLGRSEPRALASGQPGYDTLSIFASLFTSYLLRNQRDDGSMWFGYNPFRNAVYEGIDAPRLAHAAWTLARAEHPREARRALRRVAEHEPCVSSDAFTALTCAALGLPVGKLMKRLWKSIGAHGRIAVDETWQDYAPGQVLLALAHSASRNGVAIEDAFRYYRHRFRYKRDFGQVSWMALAWSHWFDITRDVRHAAFVFEIADWILEFQSERHGGFITAHPWDAPVDAPGFTTAVYLEAVAAAERTACSVGDERLAIRYKSAFERGFDFLDRLIVQERDKIVLPNFEWASGGLREHPFSSHIRIDFVQHALAAILERQPGAPLTTTQTTDQQEVRR